MTSLRRGVVIALVALTACGEGVSKETASSPGACSEAALKAIETEGAGAIGHGSNVGRMFRRTDWFAVGSLRFVRDAPKPESMSGHYYPAEAFVEVDGALASGVPVERREVRVQKRLVDAWEQRAAGSTIWIPREAEVWVAVETRADGTVEFVGDCAERTHAGMFRRVVDAQRAAGDGRSPAEFVKAAVANRNGREVDALEQGPPRPSPGAMWSQASPALRQYGPDTPPHVLAKVPVRNLTVTAPAAWKSFEGTVCFRSPGAWGSCAAFPAIATGSPADVTTHFDGNGPVEIWLLDPHGDFSKPVVELGEISARQMAAKSVNLVGDASVTTYEQLLASARERPVLTPVATGS